MALNFVLGSVRLRNTPLLLLAALHVANVKILYHIRLESLTYLGGPAMTGRLTVLFPAVALLVHALCCPLVAEGDRLATLRAEHPRLLFTAEEQKRVEVLAATDVLLARLVKQNHVNAVRMLSAPTVRYEIPDGKRLLGQSRKCIERVAAMALAYRLSGEHRFADGATGEMLVAAEFKDWNPRHFLDTAEMTTALAIGYDWLYDVIDPADRKTIREAIVKLGLNEGLRIYQSGGWWTDSDNNWNQVCNGGMILGALAIADEEPELAREIITYALDSIPPGVKVYDPSGAYPEGPGYWQYGTAYTCLTISALNTALGTDFGIHKTPGLDRTGWYRIHAIGPTGLYFNYADCGTTSRPASAMFLLSRTYDRPTFAWWHRQRLAELLPDTNPPDSMRLDRFFPLEIAWYDPHGTAPSVEELPLDAFFESRQDIVTMRSSWDDPGAIYVGFKAGDNRTNHGHLDIGSFVLDSGGVRWALDLGSDNYNMPGYFGRQRWQYYRMTNHSHNTLVIGEQIQNPKAKCKVVSFHCTPQRASAIVDMTEAYEGQAGSVLRGIEMVDRRAVHVRDEITGCDDALRWGMVTAAKVSLDGDTAVLTQDGRTLEAEIRTPAGARFEIVSTRPSGTRERQNEGTSMLAVRVQTNVSRRVEISVVLQPVGREEPARRIEPEALARWPGFGE